MKRPPVASQSQLYSRWSKLRGKRQKVYTLYYVNQKLTRKIGPSMIKCCSRNDETQSISETTLRYHAVVIVRIDMWVRFLVCGPIPTLVKRSAPCRSPLYDALSTNSSYSLDTFYFYHLTLATLDHSNSFRMHHTMFKFRNEISRFPA